jgi:hypothetical protein
MIELGFINAHERRRLSDEFKFFTNHQLLDAYQQSEL